MKKLLTKTKEEMMAQLKAEGYAHVYEHTDEPGREYSEHSHRGAVTFYVFKGSILMNIDGVHKIVKSQERINVPVGVSHTAKVGENGCVFIVGEEIEGDS